jgi:hypothetical protein
MTTLGERLSGNIATAKRAAEDSAAALSQMRTAEARATFQTAQRFFSDAREFFANSILSGLTPKELFLQVGGRRYSSAGVDCHDEFNSVLQGYQARDNTAGPDSLHDPKRFASLWHEFQQWADTEGLLAAWHYCYDGGGMDSWWQLRVSLKK